MVNLIPMSEQEYTRFYEQMIDDYAQSQAKVGVWAQNEAQHLVAADV
ncbi:MAG: hypothetical protein U0694_12865 [Anaerolineae bacterium]